MNTNTFLEINPKQNKKNIILEINNLIQWDDYYSSSYNNFINTFILEAIKDESKIYFLIPIQNDKNLLDFINKNDTPIFTQKEIDGNEIFLENKLISNIKNLIKNIEIKIAEDNFFFLFANYEETTEAFLNKPIFKNLFIKKNTLFISDNATNIEKTFFAKTFTAFIFPLEMLSQNKDYKSAKKICQCLLEENIDTWNYDRIIYEFFSFVESLEQ